MKLANWPGGVVEVGYLCQAILERSFLFTKVGQMQLYCRLFASLMPATDMMEFWEQLFHNCSVWNQGTEWWNLFQKSESNAALFFESSASRRWVKCCLLSKSESNASEKWVKCCFIAWYLLSCFPGLCCIIFARLKCFFFFKLLLIQFHMDLPDTMQ